MKKIHLNLYVNEELVNKAKDYGLVISKFLENKLIEYFSFIDSVSKTSSPYSTYNQHRKFIDEKPNNDNPYSKPHNSNSGAYGLVVMTLPSHGRGRRFKSG